MTQDRYLAERIRPIVERTRAEQGLPVTVTDELTLSRVAALLALAPPVTAEQRTTAVRMLARRRV